MYICAAKISNTGEFQYLAQSNIYIDKLSVSKISTRMCEHACKVVVGTLDWSFKAEIGNKRVLQIIKKYSYIVT